MKKLYTTIFLFIIASVIYSCTSPDDRPTSHKWTRTNPGGGGAISMVGSTKSGVLLASSDISGVYRSTDKGKSWDILGARNGLLDTHVNVLGFHTSDSDIFFMGTGHGVFKTKDGGNSIYQAELETHSPSTKDNKPDGYIESIAMAYDNPSVGYLAHYENWTPQLTLMKTSNAGDNWKIIKTSGLPEKAVVVKIIINKSDSNLVYLITGKARFKCGPAQLYKSENGGLSWDQLGNNIGDILDIDLHPTNNKKIYISTLHASSCGTDNNGTPIVYTNIDSSFDEYIADTDTPGFFYSSNDGGKSFTKIIDKTGIISVDTDDPDIIRLVDILYPYDWNENGGTWETRNAGKTWSNIGKVENWNVGYSENQYFSFTPSFHGLSKTLTKDIFNSDNFYGTFGQWAWASFDSGKHINNISTQKIAKNQWLSTGLNNINGHALDVNNKNSDVIYMGGYDIGFWYSKNHGASWTRSLPDYNKYTKYSWDVGKVPVDPDMAIRGGGSNVNTILSDSKKDSTVWASFSKAQYNGETALFKSTSYGENWRKVGKGLPTGSKAVRMYGLSIDENSPVNKRTLYMTVNGSIYKSIDDGENWHLLLSKEKSGGLKFTQVDKFNRNLIFAGGEGGLWRSPDAGKHWNAIGGKFLTDFKNPNKKTRNDIIPTYDQPSLHPWEGVFDIKTDPNIKFRLYVTVFGKNKGLYRSDNAGQSFQKLITDDFMRGVAIAPYNSNIVYATSSSNYHSGGQGNSTGVQFSQDGGKTWADANAKMPWKYAGMIDIGTGENPSVWLWSAGTGIQYSGIPDKGISAGSE